MISEKCSFKDFVDTVKDMNLLEMICLTDQEATSAERLAIKAYGPEYLGDSVFGRYSNKLKGFIVFLRYGVKQSIIGDHDLEKIVLRDQKRVSRFIA